MRSFWRGYFCQLNFLYLSDFSTKESQNNEKVKNDVRIGPVRKSNPGPLAPKARIMPLDQQADVCNTEIHLYFPITFSNKILLFCFIYERLIGIKRYKVMKTPIER